MPARGPRARVLEGGAGEWWWTGRELNPRLLRCERSVIPLNHRPVQRAPVRPHFKHCRAWRCGARRGHGDRRTAAAGCEEMGGGGGGSRGRSGIRLSAQPRPPPRPPPPRRRPGPGMIKATARLESPPRRRRPLPPLRAGRRRPGRRRRAGNDSALPQCARASPPAAPSLHPDGRSGPAPPPAPSPPAAHLHPPPLRPSAPRARATS